MSRCCIDKSVPLSYEALHSHQNHDCWSSCTKTFDMFQLYMLEQSASEKGIQAGQWYLQVLILFTFLFHISMMTSEWLPVSGSWKPLLRNVHFLIFPGNWNEALNLKMTVLISLCVWGIRPGDSGNFILSPQVKKGRQEANLGVNGFLRRTRGNTVSPDVFPVMRSLLRS